MVFLASVGTPQAHERAIGKCKKDLWKMQADVGSLRIFSMQHEVVVSF